MIEQEVTSISLEYELVLRRADDYFLKRIEPVGECMIWHGPFKQEVTHRKPVIRKSVPTNQTRSASRYAWELLYPELPEHRKLRYTCGNDLCVAPEHQEIIQDICPRGHKMLDTNKYFQTLRNGFTTYVCRVCVTDAQKAKRKAKR